jgi:hypothetical protein
MLKAPTRPVQIFLARVETFDVEVLDIRAGSATPQPMRALWPMITKECRGLSPETSRGGPAASRSAKTWASHHRRHLDRQMRIIGDSGRPVAVRAPLSTQLLVAAWCSSDNQSLMMLAGPHPAPRARRPAAGLQSSVP